MAEGRGNLLHSGFHVKLKQTERSFCASDNGGGDEGSLHEITLPAANLVDEDIRTYWAAHSGGSNEFAIADPGAPCTVYALQLNFAEHNTELYGRVKNLRHRYTIERSDDGSNWSIIADKSGNGNDNTHDYIQLDRSVTCRYLRINNVEVPGGHFALSGFRVFGKGQGEKPVKVERLTVKRNPDDPRSVHLTWNKQDDATGYNISYGSAEGKLYHNYIVYGNTSVTINSLNANQPYRFTIESLSEKGITESGRVVKADKF